MEKTSNSYSILSILFAMLVLTYPASADTKPERFEAADSEGVVAMRDDRAVYFNIDTDVKGSITIPRLAAPLRSMRWEGAEDDPGISLKPGQDTWVISWKDRPKDTTRLVLFFDDEPLLLSEIKPIKKTADGSFYLPAHRAVAKGEKIRYEPQPFKNTIGYWTGKEDIAKWTVEVDKPGRFNVAVLQGCGKGQGGSKASLVCLHAELKANTAVLDFEVKETGHFQIFEWRHLGVVEFNEVGKTYLSVVPQAIKKAALMDIRAVHLIRLPDRKP